MRPAPPPRDVSFPARDCQADRFGHPRKCEWPAEVNIQLMMPKANGRPAGGVVQLDMLTYSMTVCTEHACALLKDLPRRIKYYGQIMVELGWLPEEGS